MAAIVVLAGVTELVGVLSQTIGAARRYDGPMGKSDRALVFGAITLLLACGVPVGDGRFTWLDVLLAAILLLLLQTIFNRARKALKEASGGSGAK
jgi:CDP-diacylglycerol--glycerol-3-phosphate 3-phosphatidyltransferase